jgi:hypothetical protein
VVLLATSIGAFGTYRHSTGCPTSLYRVNRDEQLYLDPSTTAGVIRKKKLGENVTGPPDSRRGPFTKLITFIGGDRRSGWILTEALTDLGCAD